MDGWIQPRVFKNYVQDMNDAGKAWLKKNGATYRIQRYVMEKSEKK
jgi:hypothetical protein